MPPNAHCGKAVLAGRLNLINIGAGAVLYRQRDSCQNRGWMVAWESHWTDLYPPTTNQLLIPKKWPSFPTLAIACHCVRKHSENHEPISINTAAGLECNFSLSWLLNVCLLQDPWPGSISIRTLHRGCEKSQEFWCEFAKAKLCRALVAI